MKRIATYDNRYKQAVETRRMILIVLLALGCVLLLPLLAAIAKKRTRRARRAARPMTSGRLFFLFRSFLCRPGCIGRGVFFAAAPSLIQHVA